MADLKLAQLPDRTPRKLTLSIMPELHDRLEAYGRLYRERYGKEEPVIELIPYMLAAFLDGDRVFQKRR